MRPPWVVVEFKWVMYGKHLAQAPKCVLCFFLSHPQPPLALCPGVGALPGSHAFCISQWRAREEKKLRLNLLQGHLRQVPLPEGTPYPWLSPVLVALLLQALPATGSKCITKPCLCLCPCPLLPPFVRLPLLSSLDEPSASCCDPG